MHPKRILGFAAALGFVITVVLLVLGTFPLLRQTGDENPPGVGEGTLARPPGNDTPGEGVSETANSSESISAGDAGAGSGSQPQATEAQSGIVHSGEETFIALDPTPSDRGAQTGLQIMGGGAEGDQTPLVHAGGDASANLAPLMAAVITPTPVLNPVTGSDPLGLELPAEAVEGQFILRFVSSSTADERAAYVASLGGSILETIDSLNTLVVRLPQDTTAEGLAVSSALIVSSEPDYYVVALDGPPDDPLYSEQWALDAVHAPDGWAALPDNAPIITVAVIDSGICAEHPDLQGRTVAGWDFVDDDALPEDGYSHGCAIAGVIAANVNNGEGIAGVAPNSAIMPLRILDGQGIGTNSDVAAAIVYAVDHGAEIINISLGGVASSSLVENAVNYAVRHNALVIAAAGNTSDETFLYPAAYPPVVAVGSVDRDLEVSSFSSRGAGIDLLAPGRDVLALDHGGGYAVFSGTSFAAPHVAGIAALELALGRSLELDGGLVQFGAGELTPVPIPLPTELPGEETPSSVVVGSGVVEAIEANGSALVVVTLHDPVSAQAESTQRVAAVAQAQDQVLAGLSVNDFRLVRRYSHIPALAGSMSAAGLAQLRQHPLVATVHLARPIRAHTGDSVRDLRADDVHTELGFTGDGVTVAVLDTGIDTDHPDLYDDIVAQKCFLIRFDENAEPVGECAPDDQLVGDRADDENGHGTGVAGIITSNGTVSPEGFAPDAGIVAVRVLDADGIGTEIDWLAGLDWLIASQNALSVDVVNMSLGTVDLFPGNCDAEFPDLANAISQLVAQDVVIFASSGNEGSTTSISSPACLSNVIAVGATYDSATTSPQPPTGTYQSELGTGWANCADTAPGLNTIACFTNSNAMMDIVAPGAIITTSYIGNDVYNTVGTSEAAPTAAGVAALMLEADGELTPAQIETILEDTGMPVDYAPALGTSFPRIDAYEAVSLVNDGVFGCEDVTEIPQVECHALVALYNSTDGANWDDNTGWLDTATPCTWYGMDCEGGHIVSLDLLGNRLNGPIPPELGNLTNLLWLQLYGNQLSGEIPTELGNLANLTNLDLGVNQLSGPIPPELGSLNNVVDLRLGSNRLTGNIPPELGSLASIKHLEFGSNQISGPIPPALGNLATLEELVVGFNQLTGPLPDELAQLSNLRYLDLDYCRFSGVIPDWIASLDNLTHLFLSANQFTGSIPTDLGNLDNLQLLELRSNQLSGDVPPSFANLVGLTELDLAYNALTASDPDVITFLSTKDPDWTETQTVPPQDIVATPRSANTVELTWTPITYTQDGGYYEISVGTSADGPFEVHGTTANKSTSSYIVTLLAPDTEYFFTVRTFTPAHGAQQSDLLSLPSEVISATTQGSFCAGVVGIPQTECLALEAIYNATNGDNWLNHTNWLVTNTPCNWFGVTCDGGWDHVIGLEFDNNGLVGPIPAEVSNLTFLRRLYIIGNQSGLTGPIPPELGSLTNLTVLWLSGRLTGSIPPELGNLTNLQELLLSYNHLSGTLPPELGNLANLQSLYIASNQLSGSIPPELGNLASLQLINLGFNQLSGAIPAELGNLPNLRLIDFESNQLSGPIPPQLGNLSSLVDLSLRTNRVSGPIPPELGDLDNLERLSLWSNQLSGDVPQSFTNLTGLTVLDLGYNMLTVSNPDVAAFLNDKDSDWADTQTIPPDDAVATPLTATSAELTWTPILYQGDGGYYEIGYATTPGGPYTLHGMTANKAASGYVADNLPTNTALYFVTRTFTPAHGSQQNDLLSPYSAEVTITSPLFCNGVTDVPAEQCAALEALYNATDGPHWFVNQGWLDTTTACDWFGVTCDGANNVVVLSLRNNGLWGTIPAALANLPQLATLDLSYNHRLTGSLPLELAALTTLRELYLSFDNLSGGLPAQYSNLTNLQQLFLNNNHLSGSIPDAWGSLANLQRLDLENNQLTGSIPAQLGDLVNLQRLDLTHNNLSGSIPTQLGRLGDLQELFLAFNTLSGPIPDSFGDLSGLNTLYLNNNRLSGTILESLGSLTSLRDLALQNNQLTGSIPPALGDLVNLVALDISFNQLTGEIPGELSQLASVEKLYLNNNALTGDIPTVLGTGSLNNLQQLDLSWNQLEGIIPPALGNLTSLRELHLHRNNLTGPIPVELASLTNLLELGLQNNHLDGVIPSALGSLSQLHGFDVSFNRLIGEIPPELGGLTQLEHFYVNHNALQGEVGDWITGLGDLLPFGFNINYNMLWASEPGVIAFLDNLDSTWDTTQTVPPGGLAVEPLSATSVRLTWDAVAYTAHGGYFEIGASPASGGPYTWTQVNKQATSYIADGLTPGITQYFVMRAYTPRHDEQQNDLLSPAGQEAFTTPSPFCQGVVGISFQECSALEALYNATDGDNWLDNTNWLVTNTPCDWFGVTCQGGQVTALDLSHNGLNGIIPAETGNLVNLTTELRLDGNQLTGTIPPALGNLTNLEVLWLHDNQLTGTIPPELGSMAALTYLHLGNNQLSGTIPAELGNLVNLENLSLYRNQLAGGIPETLSQLDTLQNLSLYNNRLSGFIPTWIATLDNLAHLHLYQNLFTGVIPPELGTMPNLVNLQLYDNRLVGPIPSSLGDLAQLETLRLEENQLSGSIPRELGDLDNLRILRLGQNQLTGNIPDELGGLTNLGHLSLWGNQLGEAIPASLGNLTNLTYLDLGANHLEGAIPTSLGNLQNLLYLSLHDNRLEGNLLPEIGDFASLQSIYLQDNHFVGDVPSSFANLSALAQCDFRFNMLGASDPNVIALLDQCDPNWSQTQTTPPTNLNAVPLSANSVELTWTPIAYTAHGGSYEIAYATAPGGPYAVHGTVNGKTSDIYIAGGLSPSTTYHFVVRSFTPPHGGQQSALLSPDSAEVAATTGASFCAGVTGIDGGDCLVLELLYYSLDGVNWTNNDGWLTSTTPCADWFGVTCTGDRVTVLNLPENNLNGQLPPQVGDLTALQRLELWGSPQLTGSIPPEIGNLANLQNLWLKENGLSGVIPDEIGDLTSLEWLDLGDNQLTGGIPLALATLPNLERLWLDNNLLGAQGETIPPALGNLGALQWLDISSNQFGGVIPSELGGLTNLTHLWLYNNLLTGPVPGTLGSLTNLQYFAAENNRLTDVIPASLGSLTNLQELNLALNQLSGSIPPELANLTNLRQLLLYENQLTGTIPEGVGSITTLENLQLQAQENPLSGPIPATFASTTSLHILNLGNNDLSGPIPDLSGHTNLELLWLNHNELSGPLPEWLGNLTNLRELGLQNNHLTGAIPAALGNLTNLQELGLQNNQLSDSIPTEIGNLSSILNLWLYNNQLAGEIPTAFADLCDTLQRVDVRWNVLTATDPGLVACLDAENEGPPTWDETQTLAPTNVLATPLNANSVQITWTPIVYTDHPGHYEIGYGLTSGGPYDLLRVERKTSSSGIVTGLENGQTYYLAVRACTRPHGEQQSEVCSAWSSEVATGSGPSSCGSVVDVSPTECQALEALYNSTNGPHWLNNTGWFETTTACTWFGITCSPGNAIIQLELVENQLNGPIPAQLGNLVNLQTLDLRRNALSGGIPVSLGDLVNLRELQLGLNNLSGTIPPELSNLVGLTRLTLDNNHLEGPIPPELGELTNLQIIEFGVNQLSGAIPDTFQNLSSLTMLRLVRNQLAGPLPEWIGNLTNLTSIRLYDNQFTGEIPATFGNLTNLQELRIQHNFLMGEIPPDLGNLANLLELELYRNDLTGGIPTELGNLTGLTILNLSFNDLEGTIPTSLGNLTNLTMLNLAGNRLTGPIPASLGNLGGLRDLSLQNNFLSGAIPAQLGNLGSLEALYLSGNSLSSPIPAALGNLTNLQWLWLQNNQLSGEIPQGVACLPNLLSPDAPQQIYDPTQPGFYFIPVSYDYNLLRSNSPAAIACLDTKAPGWNETQTILPQNIQARVLSGGAIELTWDPILYTEDQGFYEISYAATPGGPYRASGFAEKRQGRHTLNGLALDTTYYITLRTDTSAHGTDFGQAFDPRTATTRDWFNYYFLYQPNASLTPYSAELSATTTNFCGSVTTVPESECTALEAFYVSSNGPGWFNDTNWLIDLDPCSWFGVTCTGGHITELDLHENNLSGQIPGEIVDLLSLETLNLSGNQLEGPIPQQIGGLANLQRLSLAHNRLTGGIPTELGQLGSLLELDLSANRLQGYIPATLGELTNLQQLLLSANQLAGPLPPAITDLTALIDTDLGWNMLTASDTVAAFLGGVDPAWRFTQTVDPTNIAVNPLSTTSIEITWTPILYTFDGGYYEVIIASIPFEVPEQLPPPTYFTVTTADKTVSSLVVNDLVPGQTYYVRIRTHTPTHDDQQNALTSVYSYLAYGATPFEGVPNDELVDAIRISDVPVIYLIDTGSATSNDNDPVPTCGTDTGASVYWGYRGGDSIYWGYRRGGPILQQGDSIYWGYRRGGTVEFTVIGDGFQPVIAIFIGPEGNFEELACAAGGETEEVTATDDQFTATIELTIPPDLPEGTQFHVVVYGNNQAGGEMSLTVTSQTLQSCLDTEGIEPTDCDALVALFEATDGLNWENNDGWLNLITPCDWYGVTCTEGRVTRLDLPNNLLIGDVPATILNLNALISADLSYNRLTAFDPAVEAFLNIVDPDWSETQTVPPWDTSVAAVASESIALTWTPIPYIAAGGYYEIRVSTSPVGDYVIHDTTADLTASDYVVDGLTPGTTYYFEMHTFTPLGGGQVHELWSLFNNYVFATARVTPVCDFHVSAGNVAELANAIENANTVGVGTICLAANADYVLTEADNRLYGGNGLPVIRGNVTIVGSGATVARDTAAPAFRIFYVAEGASLSLYDLAVRDGDSRSGNGGGIYSKGILRLVNSTVAGNTGADGGGVRNSGGELYLTDSVIVRNRANNGGGIYSTGLLIVVGGSVVGNEADDYGGGIYTTEDSSLELTASTVAENGARRGGGIFNHHGRVVLTDTDLTDNTANSSGGIYNYGGTLRVIGSRIAGNRADTHGGGIRNSGSLTVEANSRIAMNTARQGGGGIFTTSGVVTITGSRIELNEALNGGGIFVNPNSAVTVMDSVLRANTARNGGAAFLNARSSALAVVGSQVADNRASNNGGGFFVSAGSLTLGTSTVENNRAGRLGGAIAADQVVVVNETRFMGNQAAELGGAIFNASRAQTTIGQSCFDGNSAPSGGGIYAVSGQVMAVDNWWGAVDGPGGAGGGTGDSINSRVTFDPFLTDGCPIAAPLAQGNRDDLPVAPLDTNLVEHSSIAESADGWESVQLPDGRSKLTYVVPYTIPGDAALELLFMAGNMTNIAQTAQVRLYSGAGDTGVLACDYTLRGHMVAQPGFSLRGVSRGRWTGVVIEMILDPGVAVNDVALYSRPGSGYVGQCGMPGI